MELNRLLSVMIEANASDMFITAGVAPSLKINGAMCSIARTKITDEESLKIVHSVMSPSEKALFDETSDANFAIYIPDIGRFRVSAFRQRNSAGMVIRQIKEFIPSLKDLKLPNVLLELAMAKRGLIIIVGATGAGKSTTLASIINHRNQNSAGHIITIEDPIEFLHSHGKCIVTQREVGTDTASYEIALKNSLRQSPDVISVGEIRSRDIMEYALSFAETGHLCLATLHANNANQALERIVNFFPKEQQHKVLMDLSTNLRGICAQQLIPCLDGKGRRVCSEILINTPLVTDLIRQGEIARLKDVMKSSRQHGMRSFDQDLFYLYQHGHISYDDALYYADSANEVRLMVKLDTPKSKSPDSMGNVNLVDQNQNKF